MNSVNESHNDIFFLPYNCPTNAKTNTITNQEHLQQHQTIMCLCLRGRTKSQLNLWARIFFRGLMIVCRPTTSVSVSFKFNYYFSFDNNGDVILRYSSVLYIVAERFLYICLLGRAIAGLSYGQLIAVRYKLKLST
jgi:hypothetical protein